MTIKVSTRRTIESSFVIGIAASFLSISMSAIKTVYVSEIVHAIHPILLVACTFILTAGYFHLHCFVMRQYKVELGGSLSALVGLNLMTAVAWIGFYYALKYVEPSVVSCLVTGIGPLVVLVLDRFIRKTRELFWSDITIGGGIVVVASYLVWSGLRSAGPSQTEFDAGGLPLALAASILSGIGLTGVTVFNKKLFDLGWSPPQVLAHRFYLLVVLALLGVVTMLTPTERELWTKFVPSIVFVAVVGVLIPLFALQIGIRACSPVTVSSVLALGPVLTLSVQMLDGRTPATTRALLGVFSITLLVVANVWLLAGRANVRKS
jgi:drug/metabolite transporter (DMT)-like permease